MTTAAIRARLAARGITDEPPYGCTWCGEEYGFHGRRWAPIIQMHNWEAPDQAEILERMRRRRANRLDAAPAQYHANTDWTGTHGDPEDPGEPRCADCRSLKCPRWLRVQAQLDRQRWQQSGMPHSATPGGWGGDAPW